ncbi:hypothetical protein RQP46_008019 [Phenoliferia psychrophenolica]
MDHSGQHSALLGGVSQSDDASAAPAAASALPSATFATLPFELKAIVVACVCANDREHEEYRLLSKPAEAALIKVVVTPWHGRGLYAVAEVSKELNSICAEHLYQALTTTKAASPFLIRRILPKHAQHIRTLHLSGTLPLAKKAFEIIPLLTHLTEIRISNTTAEKLFGVWFSDRYAVEEGDAGAGGSTDAVEANQAVRRALFPLRTQSITKVHLDGTCGQRMGGILSAFDNLQSISIGGPEPIASFDYLAEDLVYAMARLPRLRELTLELPQNALFTDAWLVEYPPWPKLSSLTLRGVDPLPSTFDFVGIFAATLESLNLSFTDHSILLDPETSTQLFPRTFPLLSHLRLVNLELSTTCFILESLAAPFTSPLLRIDLEIRRPISTTIYREPFRDVLQRFNIDGLRVAELRIVEHGSLVELVCLRGFEYPPHTNISLGVSENLFFDRMSILQAKRMDDTVLEQIVKGRTAALLEVLDFGREHVLALEENLDLVGMETAFEALKTLRVWQKVVRGE